MGKDGYIFTEKKHGKVLEIQGNPPINDGLKCETSTTSGAFSLLWGSKIQSNVAKAIDISPGGYLQACGL